jgi:acetamidase/formamidase
LPKKPPLQVKQGERFVIETVDTWHKFVQSEKDVDKPNGPMSGNPSTGPVAVDGIKADDVIAVHIEDLKVVGHCGLEIRDTAVLPAEFIEKRRDYIHFDGDIAHFPGGLSVKVKPMLGCFGAVPAKPSPEPWHHGGNMDIPDVCAGNIVHIRCERDGAWFACGDGHAIQGDGEVVGYSLEVSLDGTLSIGKSPFQNLKTLMIEAPGKYITVGIEDDFPSGIKSAVYSMSDFLAHKRGISLLDAYQLVSHVGDIRLGAVWPMWWPSGKGIAIPACLHLSKEYFA